MVFLIVQSLVATGLQRTSPGGDTLGLILGILNRISYILFVIIDLEYNGWLSNFRRVRRVWGKIVTRLTWYVIFDCPLWAFEFVRREIENSKLSDNVRFFWRCIGETLNLDDAVTKSLSPLRDMPSLSLPSIPVPRDSADFESRTPFLSWMSW